MNHWSEKFADISSKAWIEALRKEAQDPLQLKKLIHTTEDGAVINSLYQQEDVKDVISYATSSVQTAANVRFRVDLHKISEIEHLLSPSVQIIVEGSEVPDHEEFHNLMHAVNLHETAVHYQFGESNVTALYLIADFYESHGIDTFITKGSIYFDPIADLYTLGNSVYPASSMQEIIKSYAQSSSALLPDFKTLSISGYLIREAGGTPLQEMTVILGQFSLYMDWLTSYGISAEKAAQMIQVHVGLSDDVYVEAAKLQALQFLLGKMLSAYKITTPFDGLNAVSLQRNKTMYSENVNNWRSALDVMAAFLGGVKDITLSPQDETYRYPLAQNIAQVTELYGLATVQLSSLDDCKDAYLLQSITSKLVEAAWSEFLEMEKEGGLMAALERKSIQAKIELAAAAQKKAYVEGQKQVMGINTEVETSEQRKDVYDKPPIYLRNAEDGFDIMPLRIERLVEAFELERLKRESSNN